MGRRENNEWGEHRKNSKTKKRGAKTLKIGEAHGRKGGKKKTKGHPLKSWSRFARNRQFWGNAKKGSKGPFKRLQKKKRQVLFAGKKALTAKKNKKRVKYDAGRTEGQHKREARLGEQRPRENAKRNKAVQVLWEGCICAVAKEKAAT